MAGPDETADLESKLADALATIRALRAENESLRASLQPTTPELASPREAWDVTTPAATGGVDAHSSESAKIALFRSLFKGRTDVYAYRWEGRDGRSGYSPALRPGVRRQKGKRPDPEMLLPLDTEAIQSHLLGRQVVGIYLLLED
jgi:hypothetical protein